MSRNTVKYPFTRGDDFMIPMAIEDPNEGDVPVDITDWVIRSQVRYFRKLISELNVTVGNAVNGEFIISLPKEETALWPAGIQSKPRMLDCDIEFTNSTGDTVSSQTFQIECTEDQTR